MFKINIITATKKKKLRRKNKKRNPSAELLRRQRQPERRAALRGGWRVRRRAAPLPLGSRLGPRREVLQGRVRVAKLFGSLALIARLDGLALGGVARRASLLSLALSSDRLCRFANVPSCVLANENLAIKSLLIKSLPYPRLTYIHIFVYV